MTCRLNAVHDNLHISCPMIMIEIIVLNMTICHNELNGGGILVAN